MSTNEHEHRCPSEPNIGLIIVHVGVPDSFGGVIPGSIWCWLHGTWESISDTWYDREQMLRDEVTEEWRNIRRTDRLVFQSPDLSAWITKYAEHRGWKVPDMTDRYSVFGFMRSLKERKPVR